MDVCQSHQALPRHRAVDTRKPPLVSAKNNNAITHRTRYSSPSPATPSSSSRRYSSPNLTRTTTAQSSQLLHKRAQSAERRRPSTPYRPSTPSTPVHESSVNVQISSSKRVTDNRLQESLWPSTMRSLSVSFQSDTISIPVSKKEKPSVSNSDRTLRPTSNVSQHKQVEAPTTIRKPSPERKRSPLKGNNASDHSENSKPVDSSHCRLIDQHRWPSRKGGGKLSPNSVHSSSVEFADKGIRILPSSPRKLSLANETSKPFQKSSRDASRLFMLPEIGKIGSSKVKPVDDDSSLLVVSPQKFVPASSSDKIGLLAPPVRSQSLPNPGLRPCSPSKNLVLFSSSSRGLSPSSRSRPSTPPSKGASPSRLRPTNISSQSNRSISVLSFIADFKRGKKGAAHIENAHQLRLLYNRYLQWRFANARAEAVLYVQNATVERTLYNVWKATLSVWDSIIRKRINLQQLKLELKLNSALNDQMAYLNEWASLESDHVNAVAGAIEDLEAGILRLPVTGGAMADSDDLKVAICSAVDVMQAMGSTICSLLARVEGMNNLVSELAIVAAQEKAMLDECEELLASATAMQGEENSLRTHHMQMKQALETNQ